jgi:hypothetical protein
MKIICDFIKIKDEVEVCLEFKADKNSQIIAILSVSSENFKKDIEIFSVPVCESFIYKYTKEYVVKDYQLLDALLWGDPYSYLAEVLNKHFERIDDFSIEIKYIPFSAKDNDLEFQILFVSPKNNIKIEINNIDESDEDHTFEYNLIKEACVGLDSKKIEQDDYDAQF